MVLEVMGVKHLKEVWAIEKGSFDCPWDMVDFIPGICDCTSLVALYEGVVCGYLIVDIHSDPFEITNLAVCKLGRRRSIGSGLVRALIVSVNSLPKSKRPNNLVAFIREKNVGAQVFFRALGFRCHAIMRDYYVSHETEDAYKMVHQFPKEGSKGFNPFAHVLTTMGINSE